MKLSGVICVLAASFALSGCGGGGGGLRLFSAFSNLQPNQNVQMPGFGLNTRYEIDQASGEVTAEASEATVGSVSLSVDAGGSVSKASLEFPPGPGFGTPTRLRFDTAQGATFADGDTLDPIASDFIIAETASGSPAAIVADPIAAGFEYQSFGVWATGLNANSGQAGVFTAGASIANSSFGGVPAAGMASYRGMSNGFYLDPDGNAFLTFADFDADIDFGAQTIALSTVGTDVIDISTGVSSAMGSLDFTGDGTVLADGDIAAAISATNLAGNLDGILYGPNAEELGGVFEMTGAAGRYLGAVGAAQ
ncbi:MAG: transferrin-binding protein-like solute binding protein [Paracoccaceae bacterium]|nr:transferrin-binding protein-like solute binding protein [Paracoccaceae bacterium]